MLTSLPAKNKYLTAYLLSNGLIMGMLMILIHQLHHLLQVHSFPEPEPWYSEYEPIFTSILSFVVLAGAPLWSYRIKVDIVSKRAFFLFWETGLLIFTVYHTLIGYHWYPGFFEMDMASCAKSLHFPRATSLVYAIKLLKDVLNGFIFANAYVNFGYIMPLVFVIEKYKLSFSRFVFAILLMVIPAVAWGYIFITTYYYVLRQFIA